jgi:hypothetical protein
MASSSLLLVLLLTTHLTASIQASNYDLSNPTSAERFFANSNINVLEDDQGSLSWTASTPLAVGCGVSILSATQSVTGDNNYEYYWQHVFSDTMDASVPTVDHVISFDASDLTLVDVDTGASQSDGTIGKLAFRMFAFLPYGKGVFVSRSYALELSNSTMYALDFNDGYSGTLPKYPSPAFMTGTNSQWADFMGDPLAFAQGPCYESIDLTAGDSNVIIVGGGSDNEGACVCEVDNGGFKRRRMQDAQGCNEFSSPLVNYTLSMGAVAFSLDLNEEDGKVASSFYYGIDPSPEGEDGVIDYSYDAMYDSDGFNGENETIMLHHGIVRADEVAADPAATAPLDVLPIDNGSVSYGNFVIGGVWIDSFCGVHYSRETRIPLSEVVEFIPTKQPSKQPSTTSENDSSSSSSSTNESICPNGSVRNIASSSQGAFVLDVSSTYSESYIAYNAIDEDPSTEWSTSGDGNDAYITIQLPFPSNIISVDFHTRTMTTSAQISEYQVEAGNVFGDLAVVASSCQVPDATKTYECNLDFSDDNSMSEGAVNVTLVTFRVKDSSGGNTGAVDLSVFGCSVADAELADVLNGEASDESSSNEGSDTNSTVDIQKVVSSSGGVETRMIGLFKAVVLCVTCGLLM